MITQYTRMDVADNTGAKSIQCIQVLKGSAAGVGKKRLRKGGVGDIAICSVKAALPNSDIKKGDKVRCVIVRTKLSRRVAQDGTYVRFDTNAAVILSTPEGNPQGHARLRRRRPRAAREELHEDHLAG